MLAIPGKEGAFVRSVLAHSPGVVRTVFLHTALAHSVLALQWGCLFFPGLLNMHSKAGGRRDVLVHGWPRLQTDCFIKHNNADCSNRCCQAWSDAGPTNGSQNKAHVTLPAARTCLPMRC